MNLVDEAKKMRQEIIDLRHFFHQNPEIGMNLPVTTDKVKKVLTSLRIDFEEIIGSGIKATIGKKEGKKILLRADMDALPIQEMTDLSYKSLRDGAMHACGHDLHTTMLLGAAMLLKEKEHCLDGEVILMFQPGEEGYNGALHMIEAGLLEPKPDYAIAIHIVAFDQYETGIVILSTGVTHASCDHFTVQISGKGGHGSEPHKCRNPIYAAIKMIEGITDLSRHEVDSKSPVVLTVCQINAGTASNIIPENCSFKGTLRTVDDKDRQQILKRMDEVVEGISKAYDLRSSISLQNSMSVVKNNDGFVKQVFSWLEESDSGLQLAPLDNYMGMGSEDFSFISQKVPSCYIHVMSKSPEGKHYPEHNENVVFDDESVFYGVATYTKIALSYLTKEERGKL
jgi:amidohydrolase